MHCYDGDSTRTRFVDFCDGGDQNDAIRSFNSLFSLLFRQVVGLEIRGVQKLQRDALVTMVVFRF